MPAKLLDAPKGIPTQAPYGSTSRQCMDMSSMPAKGTRATIMTVPATGTTTEAVAAAWTKIIQTLLEHHTAYQLSNLR